MRRLGDPTPLAAAEINECYAGFKTQNFAIGGQVFLDEARPVFTGRLGYTLPRVRAALSLATSPLTQSTKVEIIWSSARDSG